MKEIRTVKIPVTVDCEVLYYLYITPVCWDPHFAPDPPHPYRKNGRTVYFTTREAAEKKLEKYKKECLYATVEIRKKVTPLD